MIELEKLDVLILIRLSAPPKRASASSLRKPLERYVSADIPRGQFPAVFDERVASLRERGLVEGDRFELTAAGRAHLVSIVGAEKLSMRAAPKVLSALALGLDPGDPKVRKRMADAEGIAAAVPGLGAVAVDLELETLRVHAGFLGTTGSGKTTVALNIIEQALDRGISVVMVDRKGDLCGYADPRWWKEPAAEPEADQRKKRLARSIDVALYTPGDLEGAPLALPLIAPSMAEATSLERSREARQAAGALGVMMGYRGSESESNRLVILGNAIELLLETRGAVDLAGLVEVIAGEDPALLNKIGRLNTKHFTKLVDNLEVLGWQHGELLDSSAVPLDPGELFAPKRPRLSIISTKFLGDETRIEFWVSRLLVELARWASANPSDRLQTLVFFDEADIYIPAQSKPATKEPMLDLLKRARSAGVGLLLGTQNPGDFDYRSRDNIRTWFVGRVAEKRAVGKMKALLSDYRANIESRLAKQKTGEFFLLGDGVIELHSARSIMETRQLPEDAIRRLATTPRPASV